MYLKFKKFTLTFSLIILLIYAPFFITPKLVDKFYDTFVSFPYKALIWGSVLYSYKISENLHLKYIKYNIENSYLTNKRYTYSRILFLRNFETYNKDIYGDILYEISDLIFLNHNRDIEIFEKKIKLSMYLEKDIEKNLQLLFENWKKYPLSIELTELFFDNYRFKNDKECFEYMDQSFFGNKINTLNVAREENIKKLQNKNNYPMPYDTLQTISEEDNIFKFIIENQVNTEFLRIDFQSSSKYLLNIKINGIDFHKIAEVFHYENVPVEFTTFTMSEEWQVILI